MWLIAMYRTIFGFVSILSVLASRSGAAVLPYKDHNKSLFLKLACWAILNTLGFVVSQSHLAMFEIGSLPPSHSVEWNLNCYF